MEYMNEQIVAFLVLVVLFTGIAGCMGTPSPAATPTITPTPSLEPAQSVAPVTTAVPVGTTTAPENTGSCTTGEDCVPAQCCHPTSCINKEAKGVCTLLCTQVCEGPLDCGAGSCGCVEGSCSVVPESSGTSTGTTSLSVNASPNRYSPIMSSTPGVKLTPVVSGYSAGNATFTWTATMGQFISWDSPDYTIQVLGNPATTMDETVYWTFISRPASIKNPVIITVIATDPVTSSPLGNAQVTLNWDGSNAVYVGETT